MYQTTKILGGEPLRLDASVADRRIRGVVIYNNTPVYLYVGPDQNPTRETAMLIVTPYTDVSAPVDCAGALYVAEGPAIGPVPGGARATVLYGPETVPLSHRSVGRGALIPVMRATLNAAGSSSLTSQGLRLNTVSNTADGDGTVSPAGAAPLAIPASGRRRTLYGRVTSGGNSMTAVKLMTSADGVSWIMAAQPVSAAATEFAFNLPENLALLPFVRVDVTGSAYPLPVAIDLGVDL